MEKGIDAYIKEQFHLPPVDIRTYSQMCIRDRECRVIIAHWDLWISLRRSEVFYL